MNLFIYKYHTFVSCSFELSETSPAVSERHSSTKQLDTMKTMVTKIVPFPFILEKQEAYKPVSMSIYFKYVKELSKKSIIQRIVRTNILFIHRNYIWHWSIREALTSQLDNCALPGHFFKTLIPISLKTVGEETSLIYFTGSFNTNKSSPFAFIGRSRREFCKLLIYWLVVSNSTRTTTLF